MKNTEIDNQEEGYYEPGKPRTFGRPPKPLTEEDIIDGFSRMRIVFGPSGPHVEDFDKIVKVFSHDRFCSAFPTIGEGARFLERVLPDFLKEFGLERMSGEMEQSKAQAYDLLEFDLWHNKGQIGVGGWETKLISMEVPPVEQSYEYIGEKIARSIRGSLRPDDLGEKTGAFFGWLGRLVMKKVCPETDFSFDRHQRMVAEEKAKVKTNFERTKKEGKILLKGKPTRDEILDYLDRVDCLIPRLHSAEDGLMVYLSDVALMEPFIYEPKMVSSDYIVGEMSDEVFSGWYKREVEHCLKVMDKLIKAVRQVDISYFRYIKNQAVVEGYALAQEKSALALVRLSEITRLSEEEIVRLFYSRKPKIFWDEDDRGYNDSLDWGQDAMDEDKLSLEEWKSLNEEEKKWWTQIAKGDNKELYDRLKALRFTEEQDLLGITSLFFGFDYNDRVAKAYFEDRMEEFFVGESEKPKFERERARIEELKRGAFSLPQNIDELITNADLQIERIRKSSEISEEEKERRVKVIEEVKAIILEAQKRRLLSDSS